MPWKSSSPNTPSAGADAHRLCDEVTQTCAASSVKLITKGADPLLTSSNYKDCPDSVKADVHSKNFTNTEKKEVQEVVQKMGPLMKCTNQPVKQIGRTDKAISHKADGSCYSETTTMGEWFNDSGTLVLTDSAGTGSDFSDSSKQFRGTVAHELAHGLLNRFDPRDCKTYSSPNDNPLMKEYKKAAGWNEAGDTLTETATNKAPSTYAKTNPQEDLSESVMFYLYEPDKLKAASPERYEFVKKLLGDK